MKLCGKSLSFGALAALGVVGLLGSVGFASSVTLFLDPYQSGQGGEFTAVLSAPLAGEVLPMSPTAYVPHSILYGPDDVIFQTFCIQAGIHDVYFTPGVSYTASINIVNSNPPPGGVDPGVSYLFDQFWNGTLDGYFNNTNLPRQQAAGALQAVIWYLEGDDATLQDAYGQAGISIGSPADLQAQHWLAEAANKPAVSRVQILDMYNGGAAQAQLVEVTVPLPASAAMGFSMLGAMGAILGIRKRFNNR